MITGQNWEDEVKVEIKSDHVLLSMAWEDEMTGEAAIKVGHALIEAGEKLLKQQGKFSEP